MPAHDPTAECQFVEASATGVSVAVSVPPYDRTSSCYRPRFLSRVSLTSRTSAAVLRCIGGGCYVRFGSDDGGAWSPGLESRGMSDTLCSIVLDPVPLASDVRTDRRH